MEHLPMAKHRHNRLRIDWAKELWFLRNHWYVFLKPRLTGKVRKTWISNKP